MKTVYYARSIRGDHKEDDNLVFRAVMKAIKGAGHKPSLETPVTLHKADFENACDYIFARDIAWLDAADCIICEVSSASTGVGIEIGYALWKRHIPILCVARKDERVSCMVDGEKRLMNLHYYRDTSDLTSIIEEFLAQFSQ